MNKFEFEFGKYRELEQPVNDYNSDKQPKKLIWFEGNLEATFYDAYMGVSVSLAHVFNYYVTNESHSISLTPNPIKHFILDKLYLLATNQIKSNELINPSSGKPHYIFFPHAGRNTGSSYHVFMNFKIWFTAIFNRKFSNKETYGKILKEQKEYEEKYREKTTPIKGLRAIEKNLKLYNSRKTRLDKVQTILNRFYPLREQRNTITKSLEAEKDTKQLKAIQFKLETIELKWQLLIKQLDEIYKNPATLV